MTHQINKNGGKERTRIPEAERCRQNAPIISEIKGTRVYESEPIYETCWAYMKLLREHDRTKKIYPVDPYAEVYQFRRNMYGILTESLDGMGDPWMYLTVGPEKALLVDTGFGIGDLKGLVRELAGERELIVVNTHGHYDHAYGNAQFERVYCHEYEVPSLSGQDSHIWDYLFEEGTGRGIWAEFDRNDLIHFQPYEIIGCPDGYLFDLGEGYQVELVFLGGHSSGHAGFLDHQNRVFFAGDDILSMRVGIGRPRPENPYQQYASLFTLNETMTRLAARVNEFDAVFTGHFVTDLESSSVCAMAAACSEVLSDPLHNYTRVTQTERGTQYLKYVPGLGEIAYTEENIGLPALKQNFQENTDA